MPEHETHPSAVRHRGSCEKAPASDGQAANAQASSQTDSRAQNSSGTSEQRYRLLFEHNLAGVYCTTLDGTILDCNESLAKLLGYDSREDIISHRASDLYLASADREEFLARLVEAGTLTNSELCLRRKDGTPIHILENVILLPDEEGALTIIQGTMVDITQRKQAEEALRKSQTALTAVFHSAPVMMFLLDYDRHVLEINHAAEEAAARSAQETKGLGFGNAVRCIRSSDNPDGCGFGPYCETCPLRRVVSDTFETGKPHYQVEAKFTLGNAHEQLDKYFLISTSLPDVAADRRVLVCLQDITARRLAEEARRESEQRYRALAGDLRRVMQRLQTVREEERARIARELHDELGQTLTALNMDLHWLKGRSWREPEATRARIASMSDLLNTTLKAIRRICSDLRPSILDDFGLSAAIEWQAHEFQTRTGIRCRVSCPAALPTLPNEQMTAVFRIFQESLTNIARHARATEAEVTLIATSDTLVLTVADNGIGIAQEEAAGASSVGLIGMRERALRWGGRWKSPALRARAPL